VFERFTERARQVVVLAQDEARALRHNYVGTEHLLLALLREDTSRAAQVLDSFDVTHEEVVAQVARIVGRGDEPVGGEIPFTPRATRVLERALGEADALGRKEVSTEHVLLALAREGDAVAARILLDFDVDDADIRQAVLAAVSGQPVQRSESFVFEEGKDGDQILSEIPPAGGTFHAPRQAPLRLAMALAAVGFPFGVLVGFLIWGRRRPA
jgi:ATP-dependent Clp protease ATP-binding subunit ClpC